MVVHSPLREQAAPLIIRPSKGWTMLNLQELWQYRELMFFLTWRDIKVLYKQTVMGGIWAVLQPFLTMIAFSIIFGKLVGVPSEGVPYPVFAYCALLPWQLFAYSLTESSNSVVANQNLITKVYFPRLVIPLSTVLAGLVDFVIAFIVLVFMLGYYQIYPTLSSALMLPFFLFLCVCLATGAGVWLSALNVLYRDVRYTIPFLTQVWLFATPIAYPSTLIPEPWRVLYGINPMAGVVEGFRWALLGTGKASGFMIVVSVAVTFVVLISGLYFFRRIERRFADIV